MVLVPLDGLNFKILTTMITLREIISAYCSDYSLIPNNVPNDTFIDVPNDPAMFTIRRKGGLVTFKCNKSILRFMVFNGYLTCI